MLRHFWDGAARVAAEHADVPVINAGDGSHEHPTQTLCDLYTLQRAKGTLKGLTVAIGGDLKCGRTVHSLVRALARFGANIVIVPARGMEFPDWLLQQLAEEYGYRPTVARPDDLSAIARDVHALYLTPAKPHQLTLFTDTEFDLQRAPGEAEPITLDALYMTRQQRERQDSHDDGVEYLRVDTDDLPGSLDAPHPAHAPTAAHRRDLVGARSRSAQHLLPAGRLWRAGAHGADRVAARARARGPSAARALPPRRAGTIRIGPRCSNPNCITRREEVASERRFRLHREAGGRAHLVCVYCDHESRIQVIGNRKSNHFHVYEEPMYGYLDGWLRDGALVIFDSVKQAEEAGYKPYKLGPQKSIMNAGEIERSLEALTDAILADTQELNELVIVGIKTAGAFLAHRLAERIRAKRGAEVDLGVVDVHGGADGIRRWPGIAADSEAVEVAERSVVLVDDVINSGWTAKEALAAIWRAGRPRTRAARRPHRPRTPPAADQAHLRRQAPAHRAARARAGAPARARSRAQGHGRHLLVRRSEGGVRPAAP